MYSKTKNIKFIYLFILFYFLSNFQIELIAQQLDNIKINHFSSENVKLEKGLSQNWIYSIVQDSNGYMWFGTWDGLNKYDGYNFTIYNIENGLSNQTINTLFEDSHGVLWIGTENGLNKLDRNSQTFKQYKHNPNDTNSISDNRITSIIEDNNGFLWFGTRAGLNRFDRQTEKFYPYMHNVKNQFGLRSNRIYQICQDDRGFIWIATYYGLVKLDLKSQKSIRYYHKPDDPKSLSGNLIWAVFQDKQGDLWIGTNNGLNKYNYNDNSFIHYKHDPENKKSLSNNCVRYLFEDSYGLFWVGTIGGGLNLFNREIGEFIHYKNVLNNTKSISNNNIYCIYEDVAGAIWLGTFQGVNKLDRNSNIFNHYYQTSNSNKSLNSNIIWSICEKIPGVFWIATNNGINIFDRNTGKFNFITNIHGKENSLINNNVRCIYFDKQDNLWIGTYGFGLDKYEIKKDKFTHYRRDINNINSISSNYINSIFEDTNGYIWFATGNGLSKFDPNTNKFKVYRHSPEDINSISSNRVTSVNEDKQGVLWITTLDGLNKFDIEKEIFTRYKHDTKNEKSISNSYIFSIYEDKTGIFWVGTSGGGLNRFNKATGEFKAYTKKDGLANNVVYSILEDENGNLWLSTNGGLSKFNIKDEHFVNYDVKDGIQSNEFNIGAFYKSNTGEMFFGGMNGFNSFYPKDIKTNLNKPTIVITAFKKFNEIQPREYFNGDTIRLNYNDNFFSFEFSALDFTNPSKNKYKYKLDNVDKNWIDVDAKNRTAQYKNVKPGTYVFRVKGSNNDGIWNKKDIALTIIIVPPWWETWVFRIFFGLFIIAIVWFLIYRRIKNFRKKHEVEKKMFIIEKQVFDLEQKALRLQMNPHFIFNSLNSIQSFILTNDTKTAINYLAKFSQLMRLNLSNSINKFIPLKNELKALTYYMDIEKLRFDNKFSYKISVDPGIDEEFIEIPPMIVQPYVENAIIHGLVKKPSKGKINIDFKLTNHKILCTVLDNGIGRKKAMQIVEESGIKRKSRGMLITQARLEILNRNTGEEYSVNITDLKDKKGNASGTKVNIILPYKEI
ncbi:MAG: histidine kinase [Bacteroidales bacterium]|nr:histidine kinase [Bacteroidales bacterium]